jgi:hypothetical protein
MTAHLLNNALEHSPHQLNPKACKPKDIIMIFDEYHQILVNKETKITKEQGLL